MEPLRVLGLPARALQRGHGAERDVQDLRGVQRDNLRRRRRWELLHEAEEVFRAWIPSERPRM